VQIEQAVAIYPEHPAGAVPQKKLEAKAIELRKALEKAVEEMKKESWEPALLWFEKAMQLDPHNVQLCTTTEILSHIKSIRRDINQAFIQNDFDNARRLASFVDTIVEEMRESIPILRDEYHDLNHIFGAGHLDTSNRSGYVYKKP
jgi:hypothetical protein